MSADAKADVGAERTREAVPPIAALATGLAVVVGVVGRLAVSSPLWLDEALSVHIASLPFGGIDDALRSEGHPPLYYWLLHLWMSAFGEGDVAARSLSAVLGVAALPLVWLVGRRIGGVATAAWSVVLLALSPYAVRYSSEARMYALLMVLVLGGALLVPDALRRPTAARLVGVAAVTGALIWTHYWSFYLLAVVGGGVLWRWHRADAGTRERAAATRVVLAMVVGGATFLPWATRFVEQVRDTGTPWSGPARPAQVVMDTISDLGTGGVDLFSEGVLLGVVLATVAAIGVLGSRGSDGDVRLTASTDAAVRPLAVVVFGTLGIGTLVGQATRSAFNSRYAAVVVPLLLVVAAAGLAKLPRRWPVVGAALGVATLGVVGIVKVDATDRTEAERLASEIAAADAPGDVVLACPDQLGVSLVRALHAVDAGIPVLPYPAIDDDPRFVEWRDYEERNDAADPGAVAADVHARAGAGAVWLVWNGTYRTFDGDCESVIAALSALRGAPQAVGEVGDERAFEHGDLLRFGPTAG